MRHASRQDPEEVRRWLEEEYPALAARAKAEGAEIQWGDEMGVRPEATQQEIQAAAAAANAHEFISRLPEGYQTVVGERGMRLSGGERQRISLARAFLKDSPILILDEPTSSVDLKTESAIIEALERLIQGRTTFVVAHRASTLIRCKSFLYIDHGTLVDASPAPSLLDGEKLPVLEASSLGGIDDHG